MPDVRPAWQLAAAAPVAVRRLRLAGEERPSGAAAVEFHRAQVQAEAEVPSFAHPEEAHKDLVVAEVDVEDPAGTETLVNPVSTVLGRQDHRLAEEAGRMDPTEVVECHVDLDQGDGCMVQVVGGFVLGRDHVGEAERTSQVWAVVRGVEDAERVTSLAQEGVAAEEHHLL